MEEQPPNFGGVDVRSDALEPPTHIVRDLDNTAKDKIWWATGGSEGGGGGVNIRFSAPGRTRHHHGSKMLQAAGPHGRHPEALRMAWMYMAGREDLPPCPEGTTRLRKEANEARDQRRLLILSFNCVVNVCGSLVIGNTNNSNSITAHTKKDIEGFETCLCLFYFSFL